MSLTAASISASWGTTRSTTPSRRRRDAAATAIARTGGVAPLMRRVGSDNPLCPMTEISSDRNASDGALDKLLIIAGGLDLDGVALPDGVVAHRRSGSEAGTPASLPERYS